MIKYVVIQLCDSSPSFCNYKNIGERKPCLMPLRTLQEAVIWGLKNNLSIQYSLPNYDFPKEYWSIITSYEYNVITPINIDKPDAILIVEKLQDTRNFQGMTLVIRLSIKELIHNEAILMSLIKESNRLNIIITDIDSLNSKKEKDYESALMNLGKFVIEESIHGKMPSVNILTDRIFLKTMNNCNAGIDFITIAPDGKFYLCPAFYYDGDAVGSLDEGLFIKNPQLLQLDYAPICKICDSYHCKRCVWLNKQRTLELNTPSHEQCVISHIERNVSAYISQELFSAGILDKDYVLTATDYMDPFYKLPRIQLK